MTASCAAVSGQDLGDPVAETGPGLPHAEGVLSVSRSPDAGYLLTLAALPRLDRQRCAFGRLLKGHGFLQHVRDARDSECKEVRIVDCGELLRSRSRSRSRSEKGASTRCFMVFEAFRQKWMDTL